MSIPQFILRFLRMGCEVSAGVFSNLGASAIDQGRVDVAGMFIAAAAVLTAAKSTTEYYLSDHDQRQAEATLTPLVRRHGTLRAAIEAVAAGQDTSGVLSRNRAEELLSLLTKDPGQDPLNNGQENLLLHIGRWMEQWCLKHGEAFDAFQSRFFNFEREVRASLNDVADKVDRAVQRQHEGQATTQQLVVSEAASIKELLRTMLSKPDGPLIDLEIEKAVKQIKKQNHAVAAVLLEDLKSRPNLTPEQRFQILKHLGHARGGLGEIAASSSLYLDAWACMPETEQGKALQAVAELNLGHRQRADELADALLLHHPRSILGLTVKVRCVSDDAPFGQVESMVPEDLRGEVDISTALAARALQTDDLVAAERYASKAHTASPELPIPLSMLGQTILESERRKLTIGPNGNIRVDDPPRVERAIKLITQALDALGLTGDTALIATLRLNRSTALRMLGRDIDAAQDLDAAHFHDPRQPEVLLQRALTFRDRNDLDDAIHALREAVTVEATARNVQLLAQMLGDRKKPGDRDEAIGLLRAHTSRVSAAADWIRVSFVELLVRLLAESGEINIALETLGQFGDADIPPVAAMAIKAIVYVTAGDRETAIREATAAAEAVTAETAVEVTKGIAATLGSLNLHRKAFQLWKAIVKPDHVGFSTRAYVQSASRCGEDGDVVFFCNALRENGHYDPKCIEIELHTLAKYNAIDTARKVLDQFVAKSNDDNMNGRSRALFSAIAISMGREDLADTKPELLPLVETVDAAIGEAVAFVLGRGEDPRLGVDYAYALVRRFPSEKAANRAVIRSFLFGVTKRPEIPLPVEVGPDTAVSFRVDGETSVEWKTIDDDTPDPSRGEISSTHDLARALWRKRPGDTVVLNEGTFREKRLVVETVLHKTIRRFHESLETWDKMFSGDPFMFRLSVKKDANGNPDFKAIFRSIDQRQAHIAFVEKECRDKNLPVTAFAQFLDISSVEGLEYVCGFRRLSVRTCHGTTEELRAGVEQLKNAKGVVLSPSAIAVLFLTGAFRQLQKFSFEMIVSTGTVAEIRRLYVEAMTRSDEGGAMSKIQGQYAFVRTLPSDLEKRRQELRDLLDWLRAHSVEVDGLSVLNLPISLREQLLEPMGRPWLESVALAKTRDFILWEEELNVGLLASQEFGIKRTWGQAVFTYLADEGMLPTDAWHEHAGQLARLRFAFTSVTPMTLVYAGRKTDWNPHAEPFNAVLEYLTNQQIGLDSQLALWVILVREAWNEASAEAARRVTEETLVRLATLPFGIGIIRGLHDSLVKLFADQPENGLRCWIAMYEWLWARRLQRGWPWWKPQG